MFVRDCMTPDPITVRPESDPLAALNLLKAGKFRHLPVLDTGGQLVGIVERRDLELFLAQAGSPGVIKRQHFVRQVMTRHLISVTPGCPLEEAADLMVQHKIGSLLVEEGGRLVGIITETDIFRQFAQVLGGGTDSLRLTVQVDDVPGQFAEVAGRVAEVAGNITSVVAYAAGEPGRINLTLRVEGADRRQVLGAISGWKEIELLHDQDCKE
ncbi:CBS and ACT domain-containing protein [Chloroflexota bacterium]